MTSGIFRNYQHKRRNTYDKENIHPNQQYTGTNIKSKMQNHVNTEGANLDHPPPLRYIFTLLSMKVLFPQNQCKSSFRKYTSATIKTYTSRYNKTIFHNLFDHILTDKKFSVLNKGLSFVPNPIKTFKPERKKSWRNFKRRMLKQYFFLNSIHENLTPFKRKSNWISTPSDNNILVSFFTRIEQGKESI